ncbi:MAG TPA: amino acid ABC transporter permease [Burkholderiales bacterium]|nr:amino acid ABC transporter permease [Burkholderiales bacterium]
MAYKLDFADVWPYSEQLVHGAACTLELTAVATVLGVAVGTAGAAARSSRNTFWRALFGAYVELVRNTPFLVQLFFVFFGLPSLGVKLSEGQAALIAMVVNLGAYSTEIIRAGVEAIPKGQLEAAASLAMNRVQIFLRVVLKPAFEKIWPALVSQIVIVMLGSAVVSQIAVQDLTYAGSYIQSRNFRAFEVYLVITGLYLVMAVFVRQLLLGFGRWYFGRA